MMIRNIWGVGRNYADHAKELNNPIPAKPLIFLKAGSSATVNSNEILLPAFLGEVHHEVELALKFSSHLHIIEGAVALDLTDRTEQSRAKKAGEPWTLAKSFHDACPVSSFFTIRNLADLKEQVLRLWVNGELRQESPLSNMIFPPAQLVEFVKEHFPVCPGDLLLTGTPAGVGALRDEDVVKVELTGEISHQWKVRQLRKKEDSSLG